MINLLPVSDDCDLTFRNIINAKNEPQKKRLIRARARARNRFVAFVTHSLRLENLLRINFLPAEKGALLHSYNVATGPLSILVDNIKANQSPVGKSYCQYCTINEPDTIDHYLEKSNYPEFSSFGLNLVPCCGRCNRDKGEVVDNNLRQFVNLYYDTIPSDRFLYCSIMSINNGIPVLEYTIENRQNSIDPYIFQIIQNHFTKLKLNERFKNMANNLISRIDINLNDLVDKSLVNFQMVLNAEFNKSIRQNGINHRDSALLDALANSNLFLSHYVLGV